MRIKSSNHGILVLSAILILMVSGPPDLVSSLTVSGVWSPRDFLRVVARFGFLKSDVHHKDKTDGYIFGNITSALPIPMGRNISQKATLMLVDRSIFIKMVGEKELDSGKLTCQTFSLMDQVSSDQKCHNQSYDSNKKDLIRYVPCPSGGLCSGAKNSTIERLIPQTQVTYIIEDQKQPT